MMENWSWTKLGKTLLWVFLTGGAGMLAALASVEVTADGAWTIDGQALTLMGVGWLGLRGAMKALRMAVSDHWPTNWF
jgi:hypothetical protein